MAVDQDSIDMFQPQIDAIKRELADLKAAVAALEGGDELNEAIIDLEAAKLALLNDQTYAGKVDMARKATDALKALMP